MVDVEIDDRHPLGAVLLLCVTRRDCRAVEQAEAHRLCGLGVVPGRAHGYESVRHLAGHDLVDGERAAANRAQRRLQTARRHRGVGVEPHHALVGRCVADGVDVIGRMAERDDIRLGHRRLLARQYLEAFVLERLLDGAQAVGPLRVPRRGKVVQAGGMGDVEGGGHEVGSNAGGRGGANPSAAERKRYSFAAKLTPFGGGTSSGTKKSLCNGWLGSAR